MSWEGWSGFIEIYNWKQLRRTAFLSHLHKAEALPDYRRCVILSCYLLNHLLQTLCYNELGSNVFNTNMVLILWITQLEFLNHTWGILNLLFKYSTPPSVFDKTVSVFQKFLKMQIYKEFLRKSHYCNMTNRSTGLLSSHTQPFLAEAFTVNQSMLVLNHIQKTYAERDGFGGFCMD